MFRSVLSLSPWTWLNNTHVMQTLNKGQVRQESLPTFYCLMRLRAAGSCCQQPFCKNKNRNCISFQFSTPCCDDCSGQWCPQVKGSPSGLVEEVAEKSLFSVWRGLRHKTPEKTKNVIAFNINIQRFFPPFCFTYYLCLLYWDYHMIQM